MEASGCFTNHTAHNSSAVLSGKTELSWDDLPFRTLYFGGMAFFTSIYLPLLAFGITANILNIAVYVKSGARDNVTVSFLALSISDLLFLALLAPHITALSLDDLIRRRMGVVFEWQVDPDILLYIFYWYAFVFYETSILITVYISVVRCACVAIPFKVKTTFTAKRAAIFFVAFFVTVLLLRLPMLMKRKIVRTFDPVSNSTRFMYKELDDGGLADKLNDIVSRNILTWTSFVTVLTCLVVMVTKLQASAKFRSSVSAARPSPALPAMDNTGSCARNGKSCGAEEKSRDAKDSKPLDSPVSKHRVQRQEPPGKGNPQALSTREAQVVRSVVLVAVVFITCQLPSMTYSLARRFESQFDDRVDGGLSYYVFMFAFCSNLSNMFTVMNASINILVYYNFNSRFRESMKRLWLC